MASSLWLHIFIAAFTSCVFQLLSDFRFGFDIGMVELRKRKEAPPAPEKPAKKASSSKLTKVKDAVTEKIEEATGGKSAASSGGIPAVGSTIDLASFGGEVETHEGTKVSLKSLVEESKAGVVLFTYPKASTPGCKCLICPIYISNEAHIQQARSRQASSAMPILLLHPPDFQSLASLPTRQSLTQLSRQSRTSRTRCFVIHHKHSSRLLE